MRRTVLALMCSSCGLSSPTVDGLTVRLQCSSVLYEDDATGATSPYHHRPTPHIAHPTPYRVVLTYTSKLHHCTTVMADTSPMPASTGTACPLTVVAALYSAQIALGSPSTILCTSQNKRKACNETVLLMCPPKHAP